MYALCRDAVCQAMVIETGAGQPHRCNRWRLKGCAQRTTTIPPWCTCKDTINTFRIGWCYQ